ncbi:Arm DNA-binding domain-containing protein, partial [Sphingobium sp.]|uniref:Arm DNA-binding domain-containing protein n=1 Tax=Sphingobium sp. TaxID=1912891 RepID=UPI001A1E15E2
MALKDTEIRALKPRDKPYRKADSGGLYIEVFPNGSKLWRWKFRVAGKEKRLGGVDKFEPVSGGGEMD